MGREEDVSAATRCSRQYKYSSQVPGTPVPLQFNNASHPKIQNQSVQGLLLYYVVLSGILVLGVQAEP